MKIVRPTHLVISQRRGGQYRKQPNADDAHYHTGPGRRRIMITNDGKVSIQRDHRYRTDRYHNISTLEYRH